MGWKKLLWVRQNNPDNYVDSTFLSQLKRNSKLQNYSYLTIVGETSIFVGNIALTVVFGGAFLAIYSRGWNPKAFALASSALDLAIFWQYAMVVANTDQIVAALKSGLIMLFTVLSLTPVFTSLTMSTSSDSIWFISAWLCLLNLAFSSRPLPEKSYVLILNTNTSLSAAIVLASRLATAEAVFCFMLFSIQTYVLLPTASRWLWRHAPRGYWGVFTGLLLTSDLAVGTLIGGVVLSLWIILQAVVLLGFPGLFLALQKYKDQIHGPWDPARPVLASKLLEGA